MTNNCANLLRVSGPSRDLKRFWRKSRNIFGKLDFQALCPHLIKSKENCPLRLKFYTDVLKNLFKREILLKWNLENWGTKYPPFNHQSLKSEKELVYLFDTDYTPPTKLIEYVGIESPSLQFSLDYEIPCDQIAGLFIMKNGEIISDSHERVSYDYSAKSNDELMHIIENGDDFALSSGYGPSFYAEVIRRLKLGQFSYDHTTELFSTFAEKLRANCEDLYHVYEKMIETHLHTKQIKLALNLYIHTASAHLYLYSPVFKSLKSALINFKDGVEKYDFCSRFIASTIPDFFDQQYAILLPAAMWTKDRALLKKLFDSIKMWLKIKKPPQPEFEKMFLLINFKGFTPEQKFKIFYDQSRFYELWIDYVQDEDPSGDVSEYIQAREKTLATLESLHVSEEKAEGGNKGLMPPVPDSKIIL